ncbi:hypothetical protein PsYK624_163510 [Phanerochaete sordida]|uniref:Hydrophobin n=1 Tax=Phanerochaete sordida TaxID=48140 RepID=A0A9P3GRB0_9APHY|nr:hypothetical protein PsYK624_163510 [Phanerochaete sordida]
MHTHYTLLGLALPAAALANLTSTQCADTLQNPCCAQAVGAVAPNQEAGRGLMPLLVLSTVCAGEPRHPVGLSCEPVGTKDSVHHAVCCDM